MRKIYSVLLLSALTVACGKQTNLSGSLGIGEVSGELITETFSTNTDATDKLDILLIIDGSSSMSEQRAKIARKLESLLEHIKSRDWQIGIASTDMTSCFAAIVNAKTPNYQDAYLTAIDNIKSSNAEQAIYMTIKALKGMPVVDSSGTCDDNKPDYLVREDSAIGILIVTDEDHQCISSNSTIDQGCEIQDLYDFLSLIRIPNITAKVYGFLNISKNDKFLAWRDEGGEPIFTRHEPHDTGDYDAVLKSISSDLSAIVQYKYELQERHDDEASEVTITSKEGGTRTLGKSEYGIVGKKLFILTTLPTDTTSISATYSYQP